MIKKAISIIILTLMLMVCTSCAGSRELNELGIITATALDIENEKIILTNEVVIPPATEPGNPIEDKVVYVQSTGDTIFEAYRNATLEFDRKLYTAHNMVVVFGEEFAKRGIGDYIVDFLNDSEPREALYMLVAKGDKGYNLLGINAGVASTSGDYLIGLIENFKYTSKTRSVTLYEYFKYFYKNKTPLLGVVQKVEKIETNKKKVKDIPSKTVLNVMGGAVFRRDKLEGYYTADEMIGFNFMTNKVKGGLIVFEVPDGKIDNKLIATKGKFTTMEIISSRTKKDIEIVDGQIHLNINVRLKGTLGEETEGLRVTELDVKNSIQKACSKRIEKYIETVMNKAQKEFQIDNLDIKNLVYIKYPEVWNEISDDWDKEIFPDIIYTVKVETNMVRTGLTNIPPNLEKGREK
ncbi:Ger(x)C family spore germination protein [Tissierella creatinophila]|uniref:Spore germination protein B3 n=1 Tax=Tissierella creatinophila DSM 6911 TaxID=1123403 RepID=A0A1U7M8J8_TISCR|nr:Ger(x)C family spore germination protein [Tissierella creatinophila]OLS03606.1 spore germination protein B3 precursor [Tissierella creatinophila DSM 6911]